MQQVFLRLGMLVEGSRIFCHFPGFLPQISGILRRSPNGLVKFCSTSLVPEPKDDHKEGKEVVESKENEEAKSLTGFESFRFRYPEFLPNPELKYRNLVREKLERRDMLKRRSVLEIPQFYVGSVLAVTTSDKHALGKRSRFVGICIKKEMNGLDSKFILRNVIELQGVEITYFMYSPIVQKIEVLRLEKRLDDELFYLRDAPQEFSTFPMEMAQEYIDDTKPVPVNTLKVPLNPRPWYERWERKNLKGAVIPPLSEKIMRQAKERAKPWEKYDLMDEYRKTTPEEDQRDLFAEICEDLKMLEAKQKTQRRKKEFIKPTKQKLF